MANCALTLLVLRADPLLRLRIAACAGADAEALLLPDGLYNRVYLSERPRMAKEPTRDLPRNWLPKPKDWLLDWGRSPVDYMDLYTDTVYTLLIIEGDAARYDLLCAVVATVPPHYAMPAANVYGALTKTIFFDEGGVKIPGDILGYSAKNKDKEYFDAITESRRGAETFSARGIGLTASGLYREWVSEAVAAAGRNGNAICGYAVERIGLYSAALSTIGCATDVTEAVLRQGGFKGRETELTYGVFSEIAGSALWCRTRNTAFVEHNLNSLFSLYPRPAIESTFNEWLRRHSFQTSFLPRNYNKLCACFIRTAMAQAAPYELRITPRSSSVYKECAELCRHVVNAGPVEGVHISDQTKYLIVTCTLTSIYYEYRGKGALSEKTQRTVVALTDLTGYLDDAFYKKLCRSVADMIAVDEGSSGEWWALCKDPLFRELITGLA